MLVVLASQAVVGLITDGVHLDPLMVDLVIRQWTVLDAVDGYLLSLPSLCDKRHRKVWPVVLDRNTLAGSLERMLARLGLERRQRPVEDVDAWIARKTAEKAAAAEQAEKDAEVEADADEADKPGEA